MTEESKSIAQVKLPELIDFRLERIRVLHWTWFAFFIAFFTWFNMAPLATTMLKSIDWLTGDHIKVLAICNVAMTIPARILIGALIDRFGPRITFSALLVAMSVPTFIFAFGDTWTVLLISRLVLSSIGASFVIGIRMTAEWFPPKDVGKAEGFYAGWGNFGSAGAAMVLPWFALTFFGGENGWRYALALSGAFCLGYGILYFFVVRDTPQGKAFIGAKKTQPMEVSTWGDLVQLILWSFPLVAALGILAWRMNMLGFLGDDLLYVTYAVLGFVYIAHCGKILQVNVPLLRNRGQRKRAGRAGAREGAGRSHPDQRAEWRHIPRGPGQARVARYAHVGQPVQILSITLFEKMPISTAVFDTGSQFDDIDDCNQLYLFDGQGPDRRRERGTSGRLTAKSISIKHAERRPGDCARKAAELTSGDLLRAAQAAEPAARPADRGAGVSRRHSRSCRRQGS